MRIFAVTTSLVLLLCAPTAYAETRIFGTLMGNNTWTHAASPYIITADTTIPAGATLTLEPGTIVKIYPHTFMYIGGTLVSGAPSSTEPVVFTSISDDSVGGDTNGDGTITSPTPGDWLSLYFTEGSQGAFHNTHIRYGGGWNGPTSPTGSINNHEGTLIITDSVFADAGANNFRQFGGTTTITNSTITNAPTNFFIAKGYFAAHQSRILNSTEYGVRNYFSPDIVDARDNWWGDAAGPYNHNTNRGGTTTAIITDWVEYVPWLTADPEGTPPTCTEQCFSNVLFLPGIMGSTLYRYNPTSGLSTKVWEPGLGNTGTEQVEQLHMNPEVATSDNPDIYAKEILREDWAGSNYYQTFAEAMDNITGEGKPIHEWEAIPYDWRLAPEAIVQGGVKDGAYISYLQPTATPYIIEELKRLAASSKSGKVTIVAHSYGGLVTKALTDALGTTTAASLIDNIIFVAVPQAGTPQAIAGMLYGKNQDLGFGLAVTEAEAQAFAETLPMAYTLLPSRDYFSSVHEQVVQLPTDERFASWRAIYGSTVENWDELHSFLTNPSDRDLLQQLHISTGIPPILNHTAHMRALGTHNTLDTWMPPDGVSVTQIAGWGIPKTVKGLSYEGKPNVYCTASDVVCQETRSWKLIPGYDTTMDGDGTVVTPSALWTSGTTGAVNYWVNLRKYGRSNFLTTINREHGDILEVPELTSFVTDFLTHSTKPLTDYTYLSETVPVDSNPRLRYTLHSPLTLDLYDDQGRHTGVSTTTGQVEEQIPGTYYSQIGEVKYLFSDASTTQHIIMNGYATGTFTFTVEELVGDTLTASTTWKDIPTTPNTKVSIDIISDIMTISSMRVDQNGDGIIDLAIQPKLNDVVTAPKPILTITANAQTVTLGAPLPVFTATISGFVDGDTAPTTISGVPSCAVAVTNTSNVGTYPILCTIGTLASDKYEFTNFVSGILHINYRFDGYLKPINDTTYHPTQSMSVFKGGSTIPVKFQLKNVNGVSVQASSSPHWLTPQQLSPMSASVDESAYTAPATSGKVFRWDSTSQQYMYNWSTKGLAAGYWYRITTMLDDGILYGVTVGVR